MICIVSGVTALIFQRPPSVTAVSEFPTAVLKSDVKT
jgi:hypothetical protein